MRKLAILGASGHGKVVADAAECCGWDSIEFFDDAWPSRHDNGVWAIVGDTPALLTRLDEYAGVVVAIGDNRIRQAKLSALQASGAKLITLLHPAATVSRYACIGVGSVVFAGVVVNVGVQVGLGAILNTGCSIDHDCVVGDAVHISPGVRLAGGVYIGDLSWIGIGANVRQLIRIGSCVTVGAGAAVVSDIADDATVVGVPARVVLR
ncbi:MAG: acetyltransferase [Pseudomonas sp.]